MRFNSSEITMATYWGSHGASSGLLLCSTNASYGVYSALNDAITAYVCPTNGLLTTCAANELLTTAYGLPATDAAYDAAAHGLRATFRLPAAYVTSDAAANGLLTTNADLSSDGHAATLWSAPIWKTLLKVKRISKNY